MLRLTPPPNQIAAVQYRKSVTLKYSYWSEQQNKSHLMIVFRRKLDKSRQFLVFTYIYIYIYKVCLQHCSEETWLHICKQTLLHEITQQWKHQWEELVHCLTEALTISTILYVLCMAFLKKKEGICHLLNTVQICYL